MITTPFEPGLTATTEREIRMYHGQSRWYLACQISTIKFSGDFMRLTLTQIRSNQCKNRVIYPDQYLFTAFL